MDLDQEQKVVVVDVDMRFWTMVVFLVKLTIAAIPAGIILLIIAALVTLLFGGMLGGFSGRGY